MYQRNAVVLPAAKLIEKAGWAHTYQFRCLILFAFQWLVAAIIFNGYKYFFLIPKLKCFNPSTPPFTCTVAEACSQEYTYEYDPDSTQSLVVEFNLLCQADYLVELTQTMVFLGAFVGSYYYTEIQHRKGRLFTLNQATSLIGISLIASVLSFWIYINIAAIFLANFALFALMNTTIIYFSEVASDNLRIAGPNIFLIGWALGSVVLSIFMKFFDGWRQLTLFAMGIPMFISAFYYRFIKDSPRYLVGQERYEEARVAVKNIAKINGRPLPEFVFESEIKTTFFGDTYGVMFRNDSKEEPLVKDKNVKTFLTLFQYKSIRKTSLILLSLRVFLTIANHGNVLSLNTFHTEASQSLLTDGVIELFGYVFASYCSLRVKRRALFRTMFFAIGFIYIAFCAIGVRPSEIEIEKAKGFVILLLVVGRWAICIASGVLFVYNCEAIPTNVRHFSFGLNVSVAYLVILVLDGLDGLFRDTHLIFQFLFGLVFFAHIKLTEEMPETYGKPLPDVIREEDDLLVNIEMY